jgi:hypothetical protein
VRVAYVVSSQGRDAYTVMTRISAVSLRAANPGVRVIVVCDSMTAAAVERCGDPLREEADEWIECETPTGAEAYRSRFVKTSLRGILDGPFIYLDSDTLVRSALSEIWPPEADVACAPNHSTDAPGSQKSRRDVVSLAAMGWDTRPDVYINSGVMVWGDTQGSRRLGADWHAKWLALSTRTREHRDQTALNAALHDTGASLDVLPHRFNAQFRSRVAVVSDSVVLHFYATAKNQEATAFGALVERVLAGDPLRASHVDAIVRRRHPWRREYLVDDIAAWAILRRGHFNAQDREWFSGNRIVSLRARLRILASRLHAGRTL